MQCVLCKPNSASQSLLSRTKFCDVYFVSFPDLSDENDKSHKMFKLQRKDGMIQAGMLEL